MLYICVEIYKFKANDFGIDAAPLSKDFSADNVKKTGLYGYIYDFSVGYDSIVVNDILDIHKYLMRKYNI